MSQEIPTPEQAKENPNAHLDVSEKVTLLTNLFTYVTRAENDDGKLAGGDSKAAEANAKAAIEKLSEFDLSADEQALCERAKPFIDGV